MKATMRGPVKRWIAKAKQWIAKAAGWLYVACLVYLVWRLGVALLL
jgi:hypothetical protein